MKAAIRQKLDLADAVWRLGLRWIAFRLRYEAEHRFGITRRRSPIQPWPTLVPQPQLSYEPIVDTANLRSWLHRNYDDVTVKELHKHLHDLQNNTFDVFGHAVTLDNWHHDPLGSHTYENDLHWSDVPQHRGIDVKRVWEPSRFGWVYDLIRLHLLDPQAGAADTFWDLFDSWCEQNPPNTGINWACGQEASIRLMAVVLAVDAMRDTLTPERIGQLDRFAKITGERVRVNMAYARSQKNNHHTSEAAGLITVGALFPHLPESKKLLKRGVNEMVNACELLIMSDGGSSQYSTNYHRVFLHGIAWAATVLKTAGQPVPDELNAALKRATNYWTTLMNPISGLVPMIGHDDGANILPVGRGVHKDARPADALVEAIANDRTVLDRGPWDEAPYWVGIDSETLRRDLLQLPDKGIVSFDKMGIHILWNGDYRVIFRCGPLDFRPSQDDQLHVDIWWRGEALTTAPGTYSYNPPLGSEVGTILNAPRSTGQRISSLGDFLITGLSDGNVARATTNSKIVGATQGCRRTVTLDRQGVTVDDACDFGVTVEIAIEGPLLSTEIASFETRLIPLGYAQSSPTQVASIGPQERLNFRIGLE